MSSAVLREGEGQEPEGREGALVMRPPPHAARSWPSTYYLQDDPGLELVLKMQSNF